ncbi:MAG: tetratricopeptide repeat protein [Acidobacteriota bacterium]
MRKSITLALALSCRVAAGGDAAGGPPARTDPLDASIAKIEAVLAKDPKLADGWVALGESLVRKARASGDELCYARADNCAEKALALAPGDPGALNVRGLVLIARGRWEDARDVARQVVAKDPGSAIGFGTLSDALLELGDFTGAVTAIQQMIAARPDLASYARAAYVRWLQGDVTGAREDLSRAFGAGPGMRDPDTSAWIVVEDATFLWHEGQYERALKGFDSALGIAPDFPAALAGKARILLHNGDAAGAAALLSRSEARRPQAATAALLSEALSRIGDAAGARAAFEETRRLGRTDDASALALLLCERREPPDVAEAIAIMTDERRKRADVYTEDAYGWALFRGGRLGEARACSERALALGTRDASLWFHAGAILIACGETAAGHRLLDAALELCPGFDQAGAAEAARLCEASPGR